MAFAFYHATSNLHNFHIQNSWKSTHTKFLLYEFFRSASFKEDDGTWKGTDDGKVVNNQPARVMDDRNGLGPQAGYIGRWAMNF